MRTYLTDEGSPLDSFFANPLDILQANVSFPIKDVFREGDSGFVKVGRFTMDQEAGVLLPVIGFATPLTLRRVHAGLRVRRNDHRNVLHAANNATGRGRLDR